MIAMNASSFGRTGGFERTYPGGTENDIILVDGPGIDPEPPCRRPLADPLDLNRVSNLRVEFHVLHPPPSAERGTGLPVAGFLLRRNRTTRPPH